MVILGFDGADARTVERMLGEGRLPNLEALAQKGTFAPLVSTNPAESAAGWAALNTGTNPLVNNIPSFIKRHSGGLPVPDFGHLKIEEKQLGELEPTGLLGLFHGYPAWGLAGGVGLAALVVFLLIFRLVLRANLFLASFLALGLGAAGGFATLRGAEDVPSSVPGVYTNNVSQPGFWDLAARGGKRAIVLDAALAFGRPPTPGARVLAGLGLPDVRGAGNGEWFLYTTDEGEPVRTPRGFLLKKNKSSTGTIFRVDERDGRIETEVYGPVNFTEVEPLKAELAEVEEKLQTAKGWKESSALRDRRAEINDEIDDFEREPWNHRASLDMVIERKGDGLAITIAGQTHEAGEGEWTDWFRLPFELNRLVRAGGITRARVMSMEDPLTIYLHTFDIDPQNPPFWQPVSSPPEFSAQLADWTGGPYETLGWSCMTNQLKDRALPVDVFLEDIEFTMAWRERLAYACLERDDWELLFAVFSTPDRVQHMMYKYHDPEHPLHDPEEAARVVDFFDEPTALKDVIPAIYEQIDRIVGEVLQRMQPEDALFMCADHGFTSFRREFEVNNWLAEEGYLVLDSARAKKGAPRVASVVDWSRTRAYSLGLGMIYVNMADREPDGIVPKEEARPLLREIGEKLLTITDPGPEDAPYAEPRRVVMDYAIMADLYEGSSVEWGELDWPCADLQLGCAEFYRVSWNTVMSQVKLVDTDEGVVPGPLTKNNSNNWSGDHASVSPRIVTGIFFSSAPVQVPAEGVSVMHVAPTVLDALGLTAPEYMQYRPLSRP